MPNKKLCSKYSSVSVPLPLLEKIRKEMNGTGFKSVSDYVTFILREIVIEKKDKKSFSVEDREKIKKRLKALGYIK